MGKVNSQNVGVVSSFNYDQNESREKLTVWAGLVIGPFLLMEISIDKNTTI